MCSNKELTLIIAPCKFSPGLETFVQLCTGKMKKPTQYSTGALVFLLTQQSALSIYVQVHMRTSTCTAEDSMELSAARGFPEDITTLLESFYSCGVTGWGEKHAATFKDALKATSLSDSQLKVCTAVSFCNSYSNHWHK